ncbi:MULTISPECIES: SDR family oxidoreductase [Halolamina]|uniref:3-hydroxybutyrate dehydrogenase n=1 Tax=Halolamina pelagica TaxID=699431 RepID=A0A1I5M215_9EURY|nr:MULTISPECIES: SDR family oxidoreductase [Halolamina]NHX35800.1 SDR family oxidoreductase [Halolamina sp. R1-12]SFP03071.1 3-hydroxybutyrate dehydrogenase [Halolamina pelagica]
MSDDSIPGADGPDLTAANVLDVDDDRYAAGSVALVTGAASGIGRATAVALAVNGCTVAATDVDADGLAGTVDRAAELDADGTVHPIEGDLTDDGDIEDVVDTAAEYGDLRFLANVAGLQHVAPIEEFPAEQYDLMQEVMLRAPTLLSKHAVPHIREAGGGAVGNMASVHGHYTTSDKVAYNVCKFGVRGLTQSLAAEGDGTVRAFSVSTGYVSTPLVTAQIPDTAEQRGLTEQEVVEDVMLGQSRTERMMSPVEVANLFVFGFSRHAKHLNGGDLLFDGGMTNTYE